MILDYLSGPRVITKVHEEGGKRVEVRKRTWNKRARD